jgi:hypothetical protein
MTTPSSIISRDPGRQAVWTGEHNYPIGELTVEHPRGRAGVAPVEVALTGWDGRGYIISVHPDDQVVPAADAWCGLHAAHDAGRAAERADVLARLRAYRAALRIAHAARGQISDDELRRADGLIGWIDAALHEGAPG